MYDSQPWKNNLTWSDFRAKKSFFKNKDERKFHAGITTRIAISTFNWRISDRFAVALHFPDSSWTTITRVGEEDYLLKHEQSHFDIAEIYARKIRKLFKENKFSRKELEPDIEMLIHEWDEFKERYEMETDHGINEINQIIWNQKIDSLLIINDEFK